MKIALTLKERLMAAMILQGIKNSSIADWKIIHDTMHVLGLSQEDIDKYEMKTEGNQMKWNPAKDPGELEYDVPSRGFEILKEELRKREKEKKMPDSHLSLAEKVLV